MGLHVTLPNGVEPNSLVVVCCESGLCTPLSQGTATPPQKHRCPCTGQGLSDPALLLRHARCCVCSPGSMSAPFTSVCKAIRG